MVQWVLVAAHTAHPRRRGAHVAAEAAQASAEDAEAW